MPSISTINAINIGNYSTYPIIYLNGRLENIILENQDNFEPFNILKFKSNIVIPQNDFYKIDIKNRTIVNKNNQNKIADLDPSSGWLMLTSGNNRITLSSQTIVGTGALIAIEWKDAWI